LYCKYLALLFDRNAVASYIVHPVKTETIKILDSCVELNGCCEVPLSSLLANSSIKCSCYFERCLPSVKPQPH